MQTPPDQQPPTQPDSEQSPPLSAEQQEQLALIRKIQASVNIKGVVVQALIFTAIAIGIAALLKHVTLWPLPAGKLIESPWLGALVGVVLGVGLIVVAYTLSKLYPPLGCEWAIQILAPIAPNHRNFIFLALLVGTYEEIVFRGVLQQATGFYLATIAFVLIHTGYLVAAPTKKDKYTYLVYMSALSACFGVVFIAFGLATCIAMHITYDLLAFYSLSKRWHARHLEWLDYQESAPAHTSNTP